jgi:hypothetical protein
MSRLYRVILYSIQKMALNNLRRVIIKHVIIQKSRDATLIDAIFSITSEVLTAAMFAVLS